MPEIMFPEVYLIPPVVPKPTFLAYLKAQGYSLEGRLSHGIRIAEEVNTNPMRYPDHPTVSFLDGHLSPATLIYIQHHIWNVGVPPPEHDVNSVILHDAKEDLLSDNLHYKSHEELMGEIFLRCGRIVHSDVEALSTDLSDYIGGDRQVLDYLSQDPRRLNMKFSERLTGYRAKPSAGNWRADSYIDMGQKLSVWPSLVREFREARTMFGDIDRAY